MPRFLRLLSLAVLISRIPAPAQFWDKMSNPQIVINQTHPPRLGLNLKKLAIAPPSGVCAEEIADGLSAHLVTRGMEVIDRQNLQSVLAEHQFTLSGYVDSTSAAKLGKMLGPTALVFIKVTRCRAERKSTYKDLKTTDGGVVRRHFSTTQIFIRGTFQTVDLATGRIFAASPISKDKSETHQSDQGHPEFPSEEPIRDSAIEAAVRHSATYLMPWTESRKVYFFDDKECGLNLAFAALKAGDIGRAVQRSEQNLTDCKVAAKRKDNTLAHAYYNAGVGSLLMNEHAKAMTYLEESAKLRGGEIVTNTIAEAERSAQLAVAAQRVEQKTAQFEQASAANAIKAKETTAPVATKSSAEPLEDRLRKLESLFKKGLITKDEFEQKKTVLLKEL